ncbi:MAG: glycosyltransferase family 4 protein [Ruthenibacterium sp.]
MKKIAFVAPWYSEVFSGGAEMAMHAIISQCTARGAEIEVLTTCVESFTADWSVNAMPAGESRMAGILVRRFPVYQRDADAFSNVNAKLMAGKKVSRADECVFLSEMINSDALCDFIAAHRTEYGLFVFIPYMFGVNYFGIKAAGDRAFLIPCLHDESYAYFDCFKTRFNELSGMAFLAKPESELAQRLYGLANVPTKVLGLGLDMAFTSDAARFRAKFQLDAPFILYAGRKDKGKNVHILLADFARYKSETETNLKLVLLGGGQLPVPESVRDDVIDLGFVDAQDKYDAYAAAEFLCQPSANESFSIVIMESWLCGRPILVNGDCAVTTSFAKESNGGLYYHNYEEFAGAVRYLTQHTDVATEMGQMGNAYVRTHFNWDTVAENYLEFFRQVGKSCD